MNNLRQILEKLISDCYYARGVGTEAENKVIDQALLAITAIRRKELEGCREKIADILMCPIISKAGSPSEPCLYTNVFADKILEAIGNLP